MRGIKGATEALKIDWEALKRDWELKSNREEEALKGDGKAFNCKAEALT